MRARISPLSGCYRLKGRLSAALRWVGVGVCLLLAGMGGLHAVDDVALQALARQRFGLVAGSNIQDWRVFIHSLAGQPEPELLRRVNEFVNRRVRFADDTEIWSQPDYWATPIETLGHGTGDCEDFTIAKYFSLRELGVSHDKLRLIYVKAYAGGAGSKVIQAHMVLGYYATPDAEPLVLDNLVSEIRPAGQRSDLAPVFSFNAEGVYAAGKVASVERLTRWRNLLTRMQAEGYAP